MIDALWSALWLVISLSVLVTFHELGHYWMARHCGVRVLRFSVGFGTPIWSRTDRHGVIWQIAAIPLGGYVAMLDGRGDEPAASAPDALDARPLGQRMAVAAAGPLANFALAIALLWLMFVIGKPDYAPVIGRAEGPAAAAGLQRGDRIEAIDGTATTTWSAAGLALAQSALDRETVALRVRNAEGELRDAVLDLSAPSLTLREDRLLSDIGTVPAHWLLPAVVGDVVADSPAGRAGLRPGDRITAIDDTVIFSFDDIGPPVQASAGQTIALAIERDGIRQIVRLQAVRQDQGDTARWRLGVAPMAQSAPLPDALERYGPLVAGQRAITGTVDLAKDSVAMLWRMVAGRASLENLSGPIGIARYATASAERGVAWFLYFLALLSVGIAILNLLPIPVLDGGHLLYYLIELVKGRPLSDRFLQIGHVVGLAALAMLIGVAFYNDLARLGQ